MTKKEETFNWLKFAIEDLNCNLESLTEWAVEARYPGDWDEASEEDAIVATANAEKIINKIKLQMIGKNI